MLLALGGLAIGVGGAVYLARHQAKNALGRVVGPDAAPRPPLVGERVRGGMKLRHYRTGRMTIEQRVRLIQDGVWDDVQNGQLRQLALSITKHCPERDKRCEAKAVYNFIKGKMRYTGDVGPVAMGAGGPVEAVDYFQSTKRSLQIGGGDCDDHVRAFASLASLNGLHTRLRVTAESLFGEHGHIYPIVELGDRWVAADTTLPGSRFGVEVPFAKNVDFQVKDFPA